MCLTESYQKELTFQYGEQPSTAESFGNFDGRVRLGFNIHPTTTHMTQSKTQGGTQGRIQGGTSVYVNDVMKIKVLDRHDDYTRYKRDTNVESDEQSSNR